MNRSPEATLNAARARVEMAAYMRMKDHEDQDRRQRREWIVLGLTLASVNVGALALILLYG